MIGTAVPAEVVRSYEKHVKGRPLEASVVATIAYFVTLVAVRTFTILTHSSRSADISIGGVHVHHLVFGVLFLLLSGFLSLDELFRLPRAAIFGVGAALVLDEFALLVFLKDVYWLPEGFLSVVALAVGLLAMAVNAWRGRRFLQDVSTSISRRVSR
jgi:hypothetical protein